MANIYTPLLGMRLRSFFNMAEGGFLIKDWTESSNHALDIAAVKYVFAGKRVPVPSDKHRWRLIEELPTSFVFENQRCLPRAWLTFKVRTLPAEEQLRLIHLSEDFDPGKVALVEGNLTLDSIMDRSARVTIVTLLDEHIMVKTSSKVEGFLVLSDCFFPGWKATVDGHPVPLYVTDYLFRGLIVPPGFHQVNLYFDPSQLSWGAFISSLSVLSVAAFYFLTRAAALNRNTEESNN